MSVLPSRTAKEPDFLQLLEDISRIANNQFGQSVVFAYEGAVLIMLILKLRDHQAYRLSEHVSYNMLRHTASVSPSCDYPPWGKLREDCSH